MPLSRVLLFLASASLLPACDFTDDGIACTDVFIASTRITVVNAGDEPQYDVRVTYSLDGGPETEAWCVTSSTVPGRCDAWETPDEGGEYIIRAESTDGQRSAQQRVVVEADECHVKQTVPVEIVLPG